MVVFVLIFSLLFWRLKSVVTHLQPFLKTLQPIITQPFASYEQKMIAKYPYYYSYMVFITENTPVDATIIIPNPNRIYPTYLHFLGSKSLTSAFLYPRLIMFDFEINTYPTNTYITVINEYPNEEFQNLPTILMDSNFNPPNTNGQTSPPANKLGLIKIN